MGELQQPMRLAYAGFRTARCTVGLRYSLWLKRTGANGGAPLLLPSFPTVYASPAACF